MEPKIQCRECGAALQADSPSGFCAPCLISLGLDAFQRNQGNSPPGELELREAEKAGLLPPTPSSIYGARSQNEGHDGTSGTAHSFRNEKPGDRIGRYRLLQEIGYGGCGVVYMAEQEEPVRRKVALKVIKLGMDTRQVVARFEAERQALAMMDHPNIAKVLDAGATDTGRPFFVMELVGGIKLTDYCNQQNLSTHQRLILFIQVCHAIQHAHQKGIIHRDIKPSNVLVATQDGQSIPKIIDFGIAKATQGRLTDQTLFTAFEQFMGTPAYMSPEQTELGGVDVDTRSDIYSLGVLLYELLTGRTPAEKKDLSSRSIEELRRTIREKEPLRPSNRLSTLGAGELTTMAAQHQSDPIKLIALLRGDLDWIVMKCLEKDRSRRYETADGLAQDIGRYLRNEPVTARPPSALYTLQKLYRRNRLLVTASVLIVSIALLGLGGVFWQWRRAETHAESELNHRKRAEEATGRAQTALNQMEAIEVRRAEDVFGQGNRREMLTYLALVLRQNPSNLVAAERVFSSLSHRHWARLACPPLMHSNRVTSATFSHDGLRVVTASADNTARVWDANTGQPICGPLVHAAEINTADFSPDGQLVVTASDDHSARVWDARTGFPVTDRLEHPDRIEMARFSPDGKMIVTLCDDRTATLWNPKTGKKLLPPFRHGNGAPKTMFFKELDFSRNGELLATACKEDGIIRIWKTKSGELAHKFTQAASAVTCVRFSPDGQLLAASYSTNLATIWSLESDPPRSTNLSQQGPIDSIEFSPEGSRVVTATQAGTAQIWDVVTGNAIGPRLRHNDQVRSAMFSPDGLRVVTASRDQTVRVWDAERGEPMTEPIRVEGGAYYVEFHPDGQRVLSVSSDSAVFIWWIPSTVSLQVPGPTVLDHAEFSPDGTRLVACGAKGFVQLIDPLGIGLPIELPGLRGHVTRAAFSPDGKFVAAAATDGFARVWSARTGQPVGKAVKLGEPGTLTGVLQFAPDGRRLFAASTLAAKMCDVATGLATTSFGEKDGCLSAQLSPDGKWVAVAGTNSIVRIWDSDSGEPVSKGMRHDDQVLSVLFSPDSRRLLTASADKTARVWDVPSGELVSSSPQRSSDILTARFNPDGTKFLTAIGEKPSVRVWDSSSANVLIELSTESARFAEFSPSGSRILVGSQSGSSQLFDTQTGERLSESLPQHATIQSAHFSPDGRLIAWLSTDGHLRIYEVTSPPLPVPSWFPELAETLAGQRFNQEGRIEPASPRELWKVQAGISRWLGATRGTSSVIAGASSNKNDGEPNDVWLNWAKWFLAPPNLRMVLPSSASPISRYALSLSDDNENYEVAREAVMLQPTNLSCLINYISTATNPVVAEWLIRRACEQALPNSPEWREAVEARESVLQSSGNFEAALAILDRQPSLLVNNPNLLANKADCLEHLEHFEDALDAYSKSIAMLETRETEHNARTKITGAQLLDKTLLKRSMLLMKMNRRGEALSSLLEGAKIPSRATIPSHATFNPIDLRAYINQSLNHFGLETALGATNSMASMLSLDGTDFEICGCVLLGSVDSQLPFPSEIKSIKVGQNCTAIHFLHSCLATTNLLEGTSIGSYVVNYEDGSHRQIPIIYGQNVRTFSDQSGPLSTASEAWRGINDAGELDRLIKCSWKNAHPETSIVSIDFLSNSKEANPILLAIAIEQ